MFSVVSRGGRVFGLKGDAKRCAKFLFETICQRDDRFKKVYSIYKCNICGNIVEIVHIGAGELVCCNQPMDLQSENTVDAALEKHVPVIEKGELGIKVKIGEVVHPMDDNHYIEWIEIIADGKVVKKYLKLGDKPESNFCGKGESDMIIRAYCNLHGLWKA